MCKNKLGARYSMVHTNRHYPQPCGHIPSSPSLQHLVYSHISLESSSDWVGFRQPEPANSWAPAPVNTCNSEPCLEEDTPSEEDAAALVARLQQEYGDVVSGMDGACTAREQTGQGEEIPHRTSDRRATARISPSDYRYDSEVGTAGDCRTRGCLGVGCGSGCGYKAARRVLGGTTAGVTYYSPCENRGNHVETGRFGGEQTNGTAVGAAVISEGECWNHRPVSANLVKTGGGSFRAARCTDGDKTPSPLPSPPAPQTSTRWRGTSKLRQPPLEADHHAATSSLLLHKHEHQHARDPPRCAARPDRKQQRGSDTEYALSGHGADPVCFASAACLDEMEPVKPHDQEFAQPMPGAAVRHQSLHQGSSPPLPEDEVSPKTQCEGLAGTLPRWRLQDEGGTNQELQQSTTNCSPQHTSRQRQEASNMSTSVLVNANAGALSPSPMEDFRRSGAARDDEKEQAKINYRKGQPWFGEPGGGNRQQGDDTATLPLMGHEGPWLGPVGGSKPGELTDRGEIISCRLTTDKRLLLGEEGAPTADVDGDEQPAGAGPAIFVAPVPMECSQSVSTGPYAPTERTEEECELGARSRCAADIADGLSANLAVQEEKDGGDFGLIAQISKGVSGAPEEVQQVLQLGEMAMCDRAQYRQCRATDGAGEAPDIAVQSLPAIRSPARIIPAVASTVLCSDPTDGAAIGRPGETRPEAFEGGRGEGERGVADIGVTWGCPKRTSQHQRREHDVEEVVFMMRGTNNVRDCVGGEDDEPQRRQQQDSATTWARDAIQRWLLRSLRRRQGKTGCAMGTGLTGDHVVAPVERGFAAARDGGMHPAVVSRPGVGARIPSAEVLPGMHIQSTVVPLAQETVEQGPAADTLLADVPRSEVSYQASYGMKSASPVPGPEQPWKGVVPAGRGSAICGHPEVASVATTGSPRRMSSPARVGRWPPQESPTTPARRILPHDQEVHGHQAHRVFCHPVPLSPKAEKPQSGSSSLGVGADGGRGGYVLPRESFISARSSGHMCMMCAGASLSAALPFRAAPPPPLGRAASLLPAGGEAGVEVQEEERGGDRRLDQSSTVWVGTTGVRMVVGDTKRGVSFCDERPEHPAATVEGQRRLPAPPPPCRLTRHCPPPSQRRFGKSLGCSSFRDNSVELAASSSMGVCNIREHTRDRQGCLRQAECRNGRRVSGVWGGAGIDSMGTLSISERQGVCSTGKSDAVCGGGGGIDTSGSVSTPEGMCPSQTGVAGATTLVGPPGSPPPHEAAAAVTLLWAGGVIGRRREIIAARTFRNPLLEALDVSNPLLGAALTSSDDRGLDG